MIPTILGISKSGRTCAPPDLTYSFQLLTDVLIGTGSVSLIAHTAVCNALGGHQSPAIDLEDPLNSNPSSENPNKAQIEFTPVHLTYIIYTFGPTGITKRCDSGTSQYYTACRNKTPEI